MNTAWLKDPPPPVFSQRTALPVQRYHRLFQNGFWQVEARKYGRHALKMLPDRDTRVKTVSTFDTPEWSTYNNSARAFGSTAVRDWVRKAYRIVSPRHYILATYLSQVFFRASEPQNLRVSPTCIVLPMKVLR